MTILRVNHVTKVVNHQMILDDVSFEINDPEIWALVAPTGSGKTTLLRTICNLIPADSGTIELVGLSNRNRNVFKDVVFTQDPSVLHKELTGYDHLSYICAIHHIHKANISDVVKRVGLQSHMKKKIKHYTYSSKQLLLLAMSLLTTPTLLLMDDPFVELNSEDADIIWRNLYQLRDAGSSILFTSPDLTSVQHKTNHLFFLKSGKLTEINSKHSDSTYYRLHVNSPASVKLLLEEHDYLVDVDGVCLMVHLEHKPLHRLMELLHTQKVTIMDIQKERYGTEQLYQEYFG